MYNGELLKSNAIRTIKVGNQHTLTESKRIMEIIRDKLKQRDNKNTAPTG